MTNKNDRAKRLAEELRKNLRRRKGQARQAADAKPTENDGTRDRDDGACR